MEADDSNYSLSSAEAEPMDAQTPSRYNLEVEKEFILKYKSLPLLWDTSDLRYCNRFERNRALGLLLPIYQQLKPHATIKDVKKKINSLRSNYNREVKKCERLQFAGARTYYPKVWFFPYLSFLRKLAGYDVQDESLLKVEGMDSTLDIKQEIIPSPQQTYPLPSLCPQTKPRPQPTKLKVKKDMLRRKLLNSQPASQSQPYQRQTFQPNLCHKISNPIALEWSDILARLDPLQRLYAKKAINDVLFEAELGNLHKHSVRINESSSLYVNASPNHTEEDDPNSSSSQIQLSDPISITNNQQIQLSDPICIPNNQHTLDRDYKIPISFLQCSLESDSKQREKEYGD